MSGNATWIWSYGDFELFHHRKLSLSREERGHIVPTIWQLYGPNCVVKFRKSVQLEQAETIKITMEGNGYLQLGWRNISCDEPVSIPKGKHNLQVIVGNAAGIPAIYVEGSTIFSDDSWEATAFDGTWSQVGTWNLNDKAVPPSTFELPCDRIDTASKTKTADGALYDFGKEVTVKLVLTGLKRGSTYQACYGESVEEAMDYENAVIRETFVAGEPQHTLRTRLVPGQVNHFHG